MRTSTSKGFTLVELIIVITILSLLATIAFVSFQGYTKDTRDANRMSTLKSIESGIQAFSITAGNYPEPDAKVPLLASGTIIGYQGNVGNLVTNMIRLHNKPVDPLDNSLYTYSTNIDKTKYQLLGFNEKTTSYFSNQVYAADTTQRVPKVMGDALGILLDSSNTPIEINGTGVDIIKTNSPYKAYLTNTIRLFGTGGQLTDLKTQDERDAYIKFSDFSLNFSGKKVLVIYPNTDTPILKNKYQSLGFNVIVDTGATTIEKINAYSPDIVVCDQYVWTCGYSLLNTLYNAGYKIVSQGNDTNNSIFPIASSSSTGVTLGSLSPDSVTHFSARGRSAMNMASGDPTRQVIETIHPNAVSLAKDGLYNKTEIVYLEEAGKGRWLHIETAITPNDTFFKKINTWMLR